MRTVYRGSLVLASLSLICVALAQAPALAVKMGLWELTVTIQMGGEMPTVDTSKFTPEQKAKFEAMMKSMMSAHTQTMQTCMTQNKFERSTFLDTPAGSTCEQTLTTNTAAMLDSTVQCTGRSPMTGQIHIDAHSPTSVEGTIKMAGALAGKAMTSDTKLTGKWLGDDCNGVD